MFRQLSEYARKINFLFRFAFCFSENFTKKNFFRFFLAQMSGGAIGSCEGLVGGKAETFISISCDACEKGKSDERRHREGTQKCINLLCEKVFPLLVELVYPANFFHSLLLVRHVKQRCGGGRGGGGFEGIKREKGRQEGEVGSKKALRNHWVGSDRFYQF